MQRFLEILWLWCIASLASAAPSLEGDYRGVLKLSQAEVEVLSRLQLVTTRSAENELVLTGFLTLYFGGFDSDEYLGFVFDEVRYNLLSGELVFDQADRDLTMRSVRFDGQGLAFQVHSQHSGFAGELVLTRDAAVIPDRDLAGPVSGSYVGQCGDETHYMELQTLRNGDVFASNPYAVYTVSGRVGKQMRSLCPNARGLPCVTNLITEGTYDVFLGELTLVGRQETLFCQQRGIDWDCGHCLFTRTDGRLPPRQTELAPAVTSPVWGVLDGAIAPAASLEGSYSGYLHHEGRDVYQPLSFDLLTYRDQSAEQELVMSGVARLSFGSGPERLTYRFARQPFQLFARQYLFANAADDHDARPVVTVMDGERLEGYWYSSSFGRVGSFKLAKNGLASTPAPMLPAIAGDYGSPDMTLAVAVSRQGERVAADPFSPHVMTGYFWYRSGISRRIDITAAAYDFYSGKIGFELSDGERTITGTRDIDGKMKLRWQSARYGNVMQSDRWEQFEGE